MAVSSEQISSKGCILNYVIMQVASTLRTTIDGCALSWRLGLAPSPGVSSHTHATHGYVTVECRTVVVVTNIMHAVGWVHILVGGFHSHNLLDVRKKKFSCSDL